jgi:hypothetical protein
MVKRNYLLSEIKKKSKTPLGIGLQSQQLSRQPQLEQRKCACSGLSEVPQCGHS